MSGHRSVVRRLDFRGAELEKRVCDEWEHQSEVLSFPGSFNAVRKRDC